MQELEPASNCYVEGLFNQPTMEGASKKAKLKATTYHPKSLSIPPQFLQDSKQGMTFP